MGVAGERIPVGRTREMLEPHERIALGVAAGRGAGIESDVYGRVRSAVIERVLTTPAIEAVGPCTPFDDVGGRIAGQGVGMGRTDEVLEAGDRVPLCMAAGDRARPQMDRDGRVRCGMVERVLAPAAGERVAPRSAHDPVRACVSGQGVGMGRADEVLEAGDRVPLRMAAGGRVRPQMDRDAGVRCGMVERVLAPAAGERIAPRPAHDPVRACVSAQGVGVGRADEVLEAGDRVPLCMAAGGRVRPEPNRHTRTRSGMVERVLAPAAGERVAPRPAHDPVRARVSAQGVGMGRADEVLEAGDRVSLRMAAGGRVRPEPNRHTRARSGMVERVLASAAHEPVAPRAARDPVVAAVAVQGVGDAVPDQGVAGFRSRNVLEARDGVPPGIAAGHRAAREVDAHPRARALVGEGVGAGPAVEGVPARPAFDPVADAVADEGVGEGRTGEVLESAHGVAGGVPAGEAVRAQVHMHRGSGTGVAKLVPPGPAREPVPARAAFDPVVEAVPGQGVGKGRTDEMLEAGDRVPLRMTAGSPAARCAGEVDAHRRAGAFVGQGVEAPAPVELVGARAALDPVVALLPQDGVVPAPGEDPIRPVAPFDGVGEGVPDQGVAETGAGEIFEPGDDVPFGGAARGGAPGEVDVHPFGGPEAVVQKPVASGASVEGVRAFFTPDPVVAGSGGHAVVSGARFDAIVAGDGGAGDVTEDMVRAGTTQEGVVARTTGEPVAARLAQQPVVVGAAVEDVGPCAADEGVVPRTTREGVAAGASGEAVVPAGCAHGQDAPFHVFERSLDRRDGTPARRSSRTAVPRPCRNRGPCPESAWARTCVRTDPPFRSRRTGRTVAARRRFRRDPDRPACAKYTEPPTATDDSEGRRREQDRLTLSSGRSSEPPDAAQGLPMRALPVDARRPRCGGRNEGPFQPTKNHR